MQICGNGKAYPRYGILVLKCGLRFCNQYCFKPHTGFELILARKALEKV